ncbi:unnamed protein product [Orchesella dallaii]|uniref:Uncharacterized protein n=1 Tax=Orchesella dallaii TaxID=48710 RepID=A0ABP1RTK3_9HEXA
MSPVVHNGIATGTVILIVLCVIFMPKMANACDAQVTIIERHQRKVNMLLAGRRTKAGLADVKRTKAMVPVRLKYAKKEELFGGLLCLQVLAVCLLPYITTPFAILSDSDVGYYVQQDLLTDPHYRPLSEIVIGFVVRVIVLHYFWLEVCRTGRYLTAWVIMAGSYFMFATDALEHICSRIEHKTFYAHYTHLRILFSMTSKFISTSTYVGGAALFWTVVGGVWISVTGVGKMSPVVHAAISLGTGVLILLCVIFLPKMANACDSQIKIIGLHQRHVNRLFAVKRTRAGLADVKRAKAIVPVRLMYGEFKVIGKEFTVEFLELMLQRSLDVVLIFP